MELNMTLKILVFCIPPLQNSCILHFFFETKHPEVVVNATVPFVHNVKYDSCDWNERSMCVLYLSYVYAQVIELLANRELK